MADDQPHPKTYEISREIVIKLLSAKEKEERLRLFDAETREKNKGKRRTLESALANQDTSSATLESEVAALREADESGKKREVVREKLRQELEAELTPLRGWVNNESNLVSNFPSCFVCMSNEEIDAVDFLRKINNIARPGDCVFKIGLFRRRSSSCPLHAKAKAKDTMPSSLHPAVHASNLNIQLTILDEENHNKWYCCC